MIPKTIFKNYKVCILSLFKDRCIKEYVIARSLATKLSSTFFEWSRPLLEFVMTDSRPHSRIYIFFILFSSFQNGYAFSQSDNFIKKAQDYLNGIQTLQAKFEEQSKEGFRSGTFLWSRKEKKISLKYHFPTYLELYLNPYTLTIYEPLTKEVNHYSIDSTPAGLLLKSYIDFKKDLKVTQTFCMEDEFAMIINQEEEISLTLVFYLNPMIKLKGWIVKDIQGNETQVLLSNVKIGITIDKKNLLPPA